MHLTRRNHYNPCYWTALWNQEYFSAIRAGLKTKLEPRRHTLYTLCLPASKVIETIAENVHFDTNLGLADMTPQSMKAFCRRHFPSDYQRIAAYVDEHPDTLVMDFESILTGIENLHGHKNFVEAARNGDFTSVEHKVVTGSLLVLQAMRSHEFMQAMIRGAEASGVPKWEYFWLLKSAWSDPRVLGRAVSPLALARWTLYRTVTDRFPLCDSPVMINPNSVMVALSPRLLVEIDLTVPGDPNGWTVRDGISNSKFREFRRRTIQNGFKDIIFSNRAELEDWLGLTECRSRMRRLKTKEGRGHAIREAATRVAWAVHGFGRVPDNFESDIWPLMSPSAVQSPPDA